MTGGVTIDGLASRSPASNAGLSQSDIVTAFNGQPVTSTGTLTQLLSQCQLGQQEQITYLHKNKSVTVRVTVAEQHGSDGS